MGDFTSKSSTFVPRNGPIMSSDSCHDPPQAKSEWEVGWEKGKMKDTEGNKEGLIAVGRGD
jgi:hypothetical protein